MNQKILYSAVGMTDPISNYRDGSLLHICRVYKPDKVFILMSKEVVEYHNIDNRYLYCIEKLGEKINHHFDVITIQNGDLVEVQNYDVVYPIIKENIESIINNMDDTDSLIVNIGSGTPAMKYSLQMLSALSDYDFTPINVSTPEKSSNKRKENNKEYEVEEQWEFNEDNVNFVNRSFETTSPLMLKDLYDNSLEKLIRNYNYAGALTIANSLKFYSKELRELLIGANNRLQLDFGRAQIILQKYGFQMPFINNNKKIFEFTLVLGVKLKNKNYGDYVRAITPLLFELNSLILKSACNFNLDEYTYRDSKIKYKINWDQTKLEGTVLEKSLCSEYKNFNYGTVYNDHLRTLISCYLPKMNSHLYDLISKLNQFESIVRNPAAHTIIPITADNVQQSTNLTPEESYDIIKKIFNLLHISTKEWNSYDKMNELIINNL